MARNNEKKPTISAKGKADRSKRKSSLRQCKDVKNLRLEFSWFLDNTRMVTVTKCDGKSFVILRELNGYVFRPRNKGIVLTTSEWRELTKHMGEIDKHVKYKNVCRALKSRKRRRVARRSSSSTTRSTG